MEENLISSDPTRTRDLGSKLLSMQKVSHFTTEANGMLIYVVTASDV
jgi:nitrate reductase NapAB chaperone NapD